MRIKKRDGKFEPVSFDKILRRVRNLAQDKALGIIEGIDCDKVSMKVISQIYDGVTSKELDDYAAQISVSMSIDHPGYGELASRLSISNLQKSTPQKFSKSIEILYKGEVVNKKLYDNLVLNKKTIDSAIVNERDYTFDYFGFKTLERSYLLRTSEYGIVERPQYMWMRVALSLHGSDIGKVLESYELLSNKYFTHASPTLFNAGTLREQLSSCFLLSTEDSVQGIFKTITDCAHISKYAGGIGLSISNVRAKNSKIRSTNGVSDGIVPMLKVYNETARYINQAGKRNGSFAVYLEPYHADICEFLDLKKNTGDVNLRARDLFYALWVPDLFMKYVEEDRDWYLMCPEECPGLVDKYGEDFEKLYEQYVSQKKYRKTMKARDLWNDILVSQIETGMPYISYKDSANKKSNQKHIGTIKSSNLCNEVYLYNTPESIAVCNIATLGLPIFIENGEFNFDKLAEVVKVAVINLNKVIDNNFYPVPETEKNNKEHRPIALGVQGLYDVFMRLKIPFDSEEAKILNKKIFEHIQYNAILTSCELAKEHGTYDTYPGSPISEGIFQHNMWGIDESKLYCDWAGLRKMVKEYGTRNSLLTALPPTASTSQILGNVESFEVINNNFYMRRVLSGNYPIINKYLVKDLLDLGLWNDNIKNRILQDNGSIQGIEEVPLNLKALYKTTWEMSQKVTINLSADRSPFIDHSQSLNIFMAVPTVSKLSSMHFYGWKRGLKTGMYYLRSLPISKAEQFTVSTETAKVEQAVLACSLDNKDACEMCSG